LFLYVKNFNIDRIWEYHLSVDKFVLLFTSTLMQDLDSILLDDRVEAWKEFDITELKDKLSKLQKLAEYSSNSQRYKIISDKMLSFDCNDTQLRLKDEHSGSQFCLIPSKLNVKITRHIKEFALN